MKKNILSVILALVMILAVCPAYAEAAHVPGDYIINDDLSDNAAGDWFAEFKTPNKTSNTASATISGEKIQVTHDSTGRAGADIYFNNNKSEITKPTAISFIVNKQQASCVVIYAPESSNSMYALWNGSETTKRCNVMSIRSYNSPTATNYTTSHGTKVYKNGEDVKFTFVIDPVNYEWSLWINDELEHKAFYKKDKLIKYMRVMFNGTNELETDDAGNAWPEGKEETVNTVTVDNIKVWEFVKEDATYSGEGYNNGNLQAGKIALSLPISYIPSGTDNKVTVLMAAYGKVTNELIAISDIEEHTFTGAEFHTFTPEMTIPDSAGEYYVKTMIWKSGTLVPLCAADVLE